CHEASSALARRPLNAPADADRRMRVTLVVAPDPVAVVVTCPGEADHLPRAHVSVAAVNRVGEESLLDILDDLREEGLAVDAFQLDSAVFHPAQNLILLLRLQRGQGFAAGACAGQGAVAIEARDSQSIERCRCLR